MPEAPTIAPTKPDIETEYDPDTVLTPERICPTQKGDVVRRIRRVI